MQRKIVFIDDEVELCAIYKDLFTSEEFHIECFSDIGPAKEYIESNDVTLCFIDYRMPEMNGPEFRELLPDGLSCVLLTGELMDNDLEKFVEVIKKPFPYSEFTNIVEKLVG